MDEREQIWEGTIPDFEGKVERWCNLFLQSHPRLHYHHAKIGKPRPRSAIRQAQAASSNPSLKSKPIKPISNLELRSSEIVLLSS